MKRLGRALLLVAAVAIVAVLGISTAANAAERIDSFDAQAVVTPTGDLDINETITWDFDGEPKKHGIFRFVPRLHHWTLDRQPGWEPWQKFDRVTPIRFLGATSPTGANADQHTERKGDNEVLRLGNKDKTVSGRQTYGIHYTIGRAVVNGELRYAITGRGWTVSTGTISAHISAPIAPGRTPRCEVDGVASPVCVVHVHGDTVDVTTSSLGSEVIIPLDATRVTSPAPVFEQRQTFRRGFDWTNGQPFVAAALAALSALALTILGRRGRDRLYGSGAVFDTSGAPERPRGLGERPAEPVEFAPPEGVAPGMIGSIRKGSTDHVALSSTLVDLAVRGHVRIEAVDTDGRGKKNPDHVLSIPPVDSKRKGELRGYERKLIDTLFAGTDRVTLSELKKNRNLYKNLDVVKDQIQNEVVSAGYWVKRPDRVRGKWIIIGVLVLILGIVATIVLAATTSLGLLGIPIAVLGIGLVVLSPIMPVRTAAGSRVNARLNGFEKLFDAGEGERIAFTEKQDIFSEYLPYAMAFGNVKQWVKRCASLGRMPDTSGWYTSPYGVGFDADRFNAAMNDFEKSLSGAMAAAAASPSSSSGGGGSSSGGGGGGSW
jgi:uncharacterized membrane protein YgcG